MANPAVVSTNTGNYIVGSLTSTTITSSVTPVDGNVILAAMVIVGVIGDPGSISGPAGWSPVEQNLTGAGSSSRVAVFSKVSSSESGSYVFSWSNISSIGFWIFAEYGGGDSDNPLDVSDNLQNLLGTSSSAPSLTPATWNNYNTLVCIWAAALQVGSIMSMSGPADMTLQAQSKSLSISFPALMLADLPLLSNASTGTKTATAAISTQSLGISLLVKQSIWASSIPVGSAA